MRLTFDCLRAPDVHFDIVYGVSANSATYWGQRWCLPQEVRYEPQDSAAAFAQEIAFAVGAPRTPSRRSSKGGKFTSDEFDGDPSRID